jgi:GrpB-like predicted nucleotidyltransferase (UPF0157 family)
MNIVIVDYDPLWPQQFACVRRELHAALADLAKSIEHVGSTSVPGLAAKPILDIDIVIQSLVHLPSVIDRLSLIGYRHQGDLGIVGRHAFDSPPGAPERHVYVCPVDSTALHEHLAFRDYLRANPQTAAAYAKLKRQLADACTINRGAYTQQKTSFIREVLANRTLPFAILTG